MLASRNFPVTWKDLPPALSKETSGGYVAVTQYGDRLRLANIRNPAAALEKLLTGCPDRDMWYAYIVFDEYAQHTCNYVHWKIGSALKWLPPGTSLYDIIYLIHCPKVWRFEPHWIERGNRGPDMDVILEYDEEQKKQISYQDLLRQQAGHGRVLRHDPNWRPVYSIRHLWKVECKKGEIFLYLAVVKGRFKIGITDNLEKRLKELRKSCPDCDMWFEYYRPMKNAKQAEQYIKAKFDLLYEWFEMDIDIDEVISVMVNYRPEWGVGPSDKDRLLRPRQSEHQNNLVQQRIKAAAERDPEEQLRQIDHFRHLREQNWRTLDRHLTGLGMHLTTEAHGEVCLHAKYHKPGSKPYTEYDGSRRPRPYDFGDAEAFRLVDLIAKISKRDIGAEFRWDPSKFWDAALALLDPDLRKRSRYHASVSWKKDDIGAYSQKA